MAPHADTASAARQSPPPHVMAAASDIHAVQAQAISLHAELRALRAAILAGAPHADLLRAAEAAEAAFGNLADELDHTLS